MHNKDIHWYFSKSHSLTFSSCEKERAVKSLCIHLSWRRQNSKISHHGNVPVFMCITDLLTFDYKSTNDVFKALLCFFYVDQSDAAKVTQLMPFICTETVSLTDQQSSSYLLFISPHQLLVSKQDSIWKLCYFIAPYE